MKAAKDKGFTLIEVILFLAVSGLFFGIAFAGIRQRSNNVQFTDAMRSLQSYIQRVQNEVYNGVNTRDDSIGCSYGIPSEDSITVGLANPSDPGQSEDCLLVGKVLHFTNDSSDVKVYPIIGRFLRQTVDEGDSFFLDVAHKSNAHLIVHDLNPWILQNNDFMSTYTAEWGVKFRTPASLPPYYWLGFIRSPGTGGVFPFVIANENINLDKIPLFFNISPGYNSPLPTGDNGIEYLSDINASFCMQGPNGHTAQLNVGAAGAGDITELIFDTDCI
jgi:type II secretory pathway pseudopilin PulG